MIDNSFDSDIELSSDILYMIDKVVRQRIRKGPFGVDNSKILNESRDRENAFKNEQINRMVNGMSSQLDENEFIYDDEKENSSALINNSQFSPSSKVQTMIENADLIESPLKFNNWCKMKEMGQRLK